MAGINKRGFKSFIAKTGDAEELNRVQQAISEAIRNLEANCDCDCPPGATGATGAAGADGADGADGVYVPPAVGVIPTGLVTQYNWSGTNTANALRHMNTGNAGANIDANSGEIRFQVPYPGTFQTMFLNLSGGFPNGGLPSPQNVARFTLRKNGTANSATYDTALEIHLGVGDINASSFSNLANSVHFAAGDWAGMTYYPVSMNGAMTLSAFVTVLFVAD